MRVYIFMPDGGYCVYYPSNIFRNTRSFENWKYHAVYSSVLTEEYSVTWRVCTNHARAKIFDES